MSQSLAARFEATILDELNVKAPATQYVLVEPGTAFQNILDIFGPWLEALDATTDGQILDARIVLLPALPSGGIKNAPVAGSRVEQTGILDFHADGDSHLWGFAIPALSNSSNVTAAGKIVVTTGQPANALATLLAGGGSAALLWTNATSQALTTFASALISFRQYAKQLARNTFERT